MGLLRMSGCQGSLSAASPTFALGISSYWTIIRPRPALCNMQTSSSRESLGRHGYNPATLRRASGVSQTAVQGQVLPAPIATSLSTGCGRAVEAVLTFLSIQRV
jgi:hypothetical protein